MAQQLRAWERVARAAQRAVARHATFQALAAQVDSWVARIEWETGAVRASVPGAAAVRAIGQQIHALPGGNRYAYLGNLLLHQAAAWFRYQPGLAHALQPLVAQWGAPTIQALARMWQLDAAACRQPGPLADQQHRQRAWLASLDAAVALVGPEQGWEAWQVIGAVRGHTWRGSLRAEWVNRLLRPILDRRKATDQGCLDLFRLLHNVRRFTRGNRAGTSPAERVGIELPDDPLTLLGLTPTCQANAPGF